jgi:hypothetical protein
MFIQQGKGLPNMSGSAGAEDIEQILRSSRESSSDDLQGSSDGLRIPQAKDGFFGYNEEKSLQHVSIVLLLGFEPFFIDSSLD